MPAHTYYYVPLIYLLYIELHRNQYLNELPDKMATVPVNGRHD